MNVYEKLNLARLQFQSKGIKKSGQNKFAGYSYFELTDILPVCNSICSELKASVVVKFDNELAFLEFVDAEKPEDRVIFSCPMSEANQKGCQPVQNLGSVQTYIKRYLYQNCFEIAECDSLDSIMNPNEPVKNDINMKELNILIKEVDGYIHNGVLTGDYASKATNYIKVKNIDGLRKTVDWCRQQVNK